MSDWNPALYLRFQDVCYQNIFPEIITWYNSPLLGFKDVVYIEERAW